MSNSLCDTMDLDCNDCAISVVCENIISDFMIKMVIRKMSGTITNEEMELMDKVCALIPIEEPINCSYYRKVLDVLEGKSL